MRWQSRDNSKGDSEITLEVGRTYFVPTAARDQDNASEVGFITNENIMLENETKWSLSPGIYRFDMEVRSGKRAWHSPHSYTLKVPKSDVNNGHFLLEISRDVTR